jgi:hypothetical protein
MESRDFQYGWWQDVPQLISKVDKLYERQVARNFSDKFTASKIKMVEARNWVGAKSLVEANTIPVLTRLNAFYIPKGFLPGPMFVFPQRDIEGDFLRAQTKPLYSIISKGSTEPPSKYRVIGVNKEDFKGPVWMGNDPETLQLILEKRYVILVEGPFDLIAARIASPKQPIMSPLTKKIGASHIAYLRMLGVDTVYLLFDNERGKDRGTETVQEDTRNFRNMGAGNYSMERLKNEITSMEVVPMICPGSGDPSAALTHFLPARALKNLLDGVHSSGIEAVL